MESVYAVGETPGVNHLEATIAQAGIIICNWPFGQNRPGEVRNNGPHKEQESSNSSVNELSFTQACGNM